ncbi:alpha/beta hydrolase [Nocardia arizonensis]|uniref:alpha/beta hydrolase n=1 Tax=Nocardia arizonensis TaxID=1141647 RepID=UPI0006D28EC6|nr:alpha/beta hydrolase family protein [Nocardia arizonensis]
MIRTSHRARLLLVALSIMVAAASAPASAQTSVTLPPAAAPDGSYLEDVSADGRGFLDVGVFSTAMNTTITVKILPAHDTTRPAPTLYLLNGASGGDAGSSWFEQTDITTFFADKHVNIVIPLGGAGSYFTDWHNPDPTLGHPAWTTFLTRELPPIIDTALHTTTVNAIAGISMAATSVFQLAITAPGLYKAIGSYSGCVRTSDPLGHAMVTAVVARWNGNATNMWGPPTDPAWTDNDPYLNADKLRGTTIYISTGTGIPGHLDTLQAVSADSAQLTWQLLIGSPMEWVISACTAQLRDRLQQLNIPAVVDMRPTGTHSWGYWREDLHKSWPVLEAALNR